MSTYYTNSYHCLILLLSIIIFFGCAPTKYTSPKTPEQELISKHQKNIIKNIASVCNDNNAAKLREVQFQFYRNKIAIELGADYEEIKIPANGNLHSTYKKSQQSYLKTICGDDKNCKEVKLDYMSTFNLIHELFHVINKDRYLNELADAFVKHPKKAKKVMSFNEEIRAEMVVVKYLQQFEKQRFEDYKTTFSKVLEDHDFDTDPNLVREKWNNFEYNIMGINLAKLFFFIHASAKEQESTLEELLFL